MLEGWFFITAALLAISGGVKFWDPEPTGGALAAAGLPSTRPVVMLLALAEILAGASALAVGGPAPVAAVGALYLGFAGFVGWALARRIPLQSCGCFGRRDTPPTTGHLVANLLAVAGAAGALATGSPSLPDALATQPALGLPYLGFVALGTWLLALALTELPALLAEAPR